MCVCVSVWSPGLLPSKAKLEFQKHLATLDNQEQAAVFEHTVVLVCV